MLNFLNVNLKKSARMSGFVMVHQHN